ncbi:plastocyanin-like domain protein [Ceratobasidium sp. AG-Ba]|nr:plastocyanin-like domain protein [Ceratobasidium sp. AG-Ba]QRV96200.1 plastocyanin-like domain protein [Ceratobasidium sp. AG-Ba]
MYFNIASVVSAAVLALPLAAFAAPASDLDLEARGYSKTYKVTVGAGGKLRYDPQYVHANVGDYIKFEFHPKNHTVTESSFNSPCHKLTDSHGNQIGFRTGFVPVPATQTSHFPTRSFKVTDTKPHWFYCGQTGHCPAGMVFAVNPPNKGNTFEKFQKKAMQSGN